MKLFAPHLADFYKTGHYRQYVPGLEFLLSNSTPRSYKNFHGLPDFDGKMVNFGITGTCKYLLQELWNETFFSVPKEKAVSRYKRRMDTSLGEGAVTMEHIAALHDLGYLPVSILTIPEGTRVPMRVPNVLIYNTHKDFAWVVNYLETQIENEIWKPSNNATLAFEYRRLCEKYAAETGVDPALVKWQCHDFSDRGLSGNEDAAKSGAAHLLSFDGTDTIQAIDYLEDYYKADATLEMIGGSIPATEHSVACSNILGMSDVVYDFYEKEFDARGLEFGIQTPNLSPERKHLMVSEYAMLKRFLTELYPNGLFSFVSDTFDFWSTLTQIAIRLKPEIMARDGKVVFRPDSGDPRKIITGDPNADEGTYQHMGAVKTLYSIFGGTVTSKHFITLDSHVGLIYGDSINLERASNILQDLKDNGFSSINIVFGVGSYTYQLVSRDSLGQAMKATFMKVNGKDVDLYKDPLTDSGTKKSARGILRVVNGKHGYELLENCDPESSIIFRDNEWHLENIGAMVEVFRNGKIAHDWSLSEIRANIEKELKGTL